MIQAVIEVVILTNPSMIFQMVAVAIRTLIYFVWKLKQEAKVCVPVSKLTISPTTTTVVEL